VKVLVYANSLTIGGEQIQAIDLGGAIRERGHEVLISAPAPGPLVEWATQRSLEVAPLGVPEHPRPSLRTVRAVRRLVRREGVDLVHAYGIPSTLDAFLGPHLRDRVPLVSSMLAPLPAPAHGRLPRRIPLIMVTRNAERDVRRMRPGAVHLLEPPVDVAREHPAVDGDAFRRAWGLEDGIPTVVIVSRLNWLRHQDKQGGIERAIQAVALLARDTLARLVIVGGGPAQPEVAAQAERANAALGGMRSS
jgi:glycosyltransferase involved in cell wall biosynthesis